ncbi:(d)CMP kinase [Lutispora thermophila]|uniref:Cytidylate kinase n=1 Tax=Lutispora thermophila DSM 19022 TaxID=1122184 RepID=A0A1M6F843_9FIRM|nr:(d)CMP kinase [Lutispora thermophila]SHI93865.1 cytidylate kinase [Lutispora thermophila DSM 19022]
MGFNAIAIDGPAGAGKSTVAKMLSERIGYTYIDSGALFRAITLKVIKLGIDINDIERIIFHARNSDIDFSNNKIYLDGANVSEKIRDNIINTTVSYIAMIPEIRDIVVEIQRKIASNKNVVVDGRDIGTTVFPNAFIKFFLTASVEERALRRYNELTDKKKHTLEEIKKQIIERDFIDANREASPLRQAEDAILIDTTGKSIDEVVSEMLYYVFMKGEKNFVI